MYDDGYSYDEPLASTSPRMASGPRWSTEASVPTVPVTPPGLSYSPPKPPSATDIPSYMVDDPSEANRPTVYV